MGRFLGQGLKEPSCVNCPLMIYGGELVGPSRKFLE